MPMGRPPKRPEDKKYKIHVAVDHEIYQFLESLDNKSEFMNKAAWILYRAHLKAGATIGQET